MLKLKSKNSKELKKEERQEYIKNFIDMISPSVIKFFPSYYIVGNTVRRVIALRNYPLETEKMALLSKLGEQNNITLKVYFNKMGQNEYKKSIEGSVNKNTNEASEYQIIKRTQAQQHLGLATDLIKFLNANPDERMFSVCVFIEIIGETKDEMEDTFNDVRFLLEGITFDNLFLHQKEGFLSVNPVGKNQFGIQFERHMPTSSVANLFPLSYSEKIDPEGFKLGRDKSGGNIIINFDKRNKTHTNSNIIILGNAGEGKSFLLKLIQVNWRLKGQNLIGLDPEFESKELVENLGGTYMDLMSGKYIINVLEPKVFSEGSEDDGIEKDENVDAFSKSTQLSQHISFLRDFFKTYKDMTTVLLDTVEIMLEKTYKNFDIDYNTDLTSKKTSDYPILSDLYKTIKNEFDNYGTLKNPIYTKENLQELMLNLYSICCGSDSPYFNGHTNIKSYDLLIFGVKNLMEAADNLKNAMLFNLLTYMNGKLLSEGNTTCFIDEFYLFLDNPTTVKYIRNYMKRVRKKDSAIVLASQNIEDYLQKDIAELTKPLFAIPTYKFLFYPGSIDKKLYCSLLNINDSEYNLIKAPSRGNCLFVSGTEKYNLQVEAPEYKSKLFGTAGGR
ncbi:ATP-binding protein [Clostridium felsineum]|uniref:VirB4 family type IV secretion system protein n=1 Tax=Clostridium felsineum TaxID=36839 RepID=UPI00214D95ED|nr:ATP-binding protein [Clostridium felsineum]MCR3758911.1 ATP-binding protein [Clostridium felsineum]